MMCTDCVSEQLGHNPLTAPCATTILQVLAQCPNSAVKELDLTVCFMNYYL